MLNMLDLQARTLPERFDHRRSALHGLQPIAGKRSEHGEVGAQKLFNSCCFRYPYTYSVGLSSGGITG